MRDTELGCEPLLVPSAADGRRVASSTPRSIRMCSIAVVSLFRRRTTAWVARLQPQSSNL
jgi:hypothetical protein